jgi:hypothetical protein
MQFFCMMDTKYKSATQRPLNSSTSARLKKNTIVTFNVPCKKLRRFYSRSYWRYTFSLAGKQIGLPALPG